MVKKNKKTSKVNASKEMYCHKIISSDGSVKYEHFCETIFEMGIGTDDKQRSNPVVQVMVTETKKQTGYFGWFNNIKETIQYVKGNKIFIELSFPFGTAVEEKEGRGRLINVEIEEIKVISDDN